jgi:ABC-type glycerol-3-phosphate transport system substrate-binding protein
MLLRNLSRRRLIGVALGGVGLSAIAACQGQPAQPPTPASAAPKPADAAPKPAEPTKPADAAKPTSPAAEAKAATPAAEPKPAVKGPVTIRWRTYSGNAEPGKGLAPKVVEAFQKTRPNVTVAHEAFGVPDWMRLFVTDVAAGTPPDVVQNATEYFDKQAATGMLLRLDDHIRAANYDIAGFHKDALKMCRGRKDNGLYALPEGLNPNLCFINKDIFADAKVEIPDDTKWTFDDQINLAKQLTKRDSRGVATQWGLYFYRTAMPFTPYDIVTSFGGKSVDDGWTKTLIGEGQARDAMKWIFDVWSTHKVAPTPDDLTGLGAHPFFIGKAAMFMNYSYHIDSILAQATFKLQINALPKGPAQQVSNLRPWYHTVAAATKLPEEASAFLMYLTSKEGLTLWAPVTYSSRPDVVKSVWEKLPPADINRPHVSGIADKLGYAAVYGPGHGDWATAMGAEMEKAWAGKASFDEGLGAAVKAGDKVLEDNNRELGLKK